MVDNDPIIWTMLNAIKEVHGQCEMSQKQLTSIENQIDQLKVNDLNHEREIASLKAKNIELQKRIEALEKVLLKK